VIGLPPRLPAAQKICRPASRPLATSRCVLPGFIA
jgi:hypothetical protein